MAKRCRPQLGDRIVPGVFVDRIGSHITSVSLGLRREQDEAGKVRDLG
jgi:hypothetical protein